MTTLVINGKKVTVSDDFLSLSPEEQNKTVDEIASQMGQSPAAPAADKAQTENVIATTDDGGRVIKAADGSLSFASPNYSTSDPAKIEEIMRGATAAETSMASFDKTTLDQVGTAGATAAKFLQGVPFVGEYVDEAFGAIQGEGKQNALRASNAAMDRQYPKTSLGLQVTGGITGSIPAVMAAGPSLVASAPPTLAGKVAAGIGLSALTGGVEGTVSGYGAGDDGDRMASAKSRGVLGAVLGGVVGGAAPVLGAGVRALIERAKGMDVKTVAKTFGISDDAARALMPDLEALDFGAAQAALRTAGPEAMLADAGQATREALDGAITGGGKAARIGVDAVSGRAAGAGARLDKIMDVVLGIPKGVKAVGKSISERTAPARKKAYDLAFNTAIDYSDDAGRNIEGVLDRIDGDTLNAAIKEANSAMRAEGVKNKQIIGILDSQGGVTFKEMPNVQQLDEIKKGLDSIARAETDELTGKISSKGRRAKLLAADLRAAIGEAVPAYKTAVKLGGDKIGEEEAVKMGSKMFGAGYTRETVADVMKGASVEAKDGARQGIREYIDDTLARVRRSIDDPNADTTETLRLLSTISSRDAREKLALVLGDVKADRLLKEIDAAGKQFATRHAIATGSATGRREVRSRALDDQLKPGAVENIAKGKVGAGLQSFIQFVTRSTPQADLARKQEVLADVARALTEMRGPQAEAALNLVEKAISGQPLKNEEALRIARLVSSTGALAGYQTGQKYLASPLGAPK
jgi:hypothetical protein